MIKLPKKINLVQGSPEWLAYRRTKIMASDAAVIMGDNPWKTIRQLYDEKVQAIETFQNEHMKRGQKLEPEARDHYNELFDTKHEPAVYEHGYLDWMAASLDGCYENNGYEIIEIKCGDKAHQQALRGEIPDYYRWQMLHQMAVMNVYSMDYMTYLGKTEMTILPFVSDDVLIESMILAEKKFYFEHLLPRIPPLSDEDYEDISMIDDIDRKTRLEINFDNRKRLKAKIKYLEGLVESVDDLIIADAEDKSIKLGDHKCLKYDVKGSVDWKELCKDHSIKESDCDKYRKPTRIQWRIS